MICNLPGCDRPVPLGRQGGRRYCTPEHTRKARAIRDRARKRIYAAVTPTADPVVTCAHPSCPRHVPLTRHGGRKRKYCSDGCYQDCKRVRDAARKKLSHVPHPDRTCAECGAEFRHNRGGDPKLCGETKCWLAWRKRVDATRRQRERSNLGRVLVVSRINGTDPALLPIFTRPWRPDLCQIPATAPHANTTSTAPAGASARR